MTKGQKLRILMSVLIVAMVAALVLLGWVFPAKADPPKSPQAKVAMWVYEASVSWIPLAPVNGWESKEQADTRRMAIAMDVTSVAFDPAEAPLFYSGGDHLSRANTAMFLASIASYESGYDVRVDTGHCEALPGGIQAGWCDSGNAHSIFQHNIGNGKTLLDGWSKSDLIADRRKAVRAALHALQHSARKCVKSYSGADAFSIYAQGFCGPSTKMRERLGRATSWSKDHPAPKGI